MVKKKSKKLNFYEKLDSFIKELITGGIQKKAPVENKAPCRGKVGIMARFNGKGSYYCKNCGGGEGVHRVSDMACPNQGEDQTGLEPQIYMDTKFDPQDWEKKKGEIPGRKFKTLEGPLFDDYFLASLNGLSISAVLNSRNISPNDIEEFPNTLVNFAFEITKAALKKREEYFSEKEKT